MAGLSIKDHYLSDDPQLSFMWEPDVTTFPTLMGIRPRVQDFARVSLPFYNFEQQAIYMAGKRQAFGGSVDALTFNMALHLSQQPRMLSWAQYWQWAVRSPQGFYGLPIDYKRNLTFNLKNNFGQITIRAHLLGCYITNPQELGLDYNSGEKLYMELAMSADDVDYESVP